MALKNTKLIQDLILFYVKENYQEYLTKNNMTKIPSEQIETVVETLYTDRKSHLKDFLKNSLKEIMKDEYIGDLAVQTICNEIFSDDEFCKSRIITEIKAYQNKKLD